MRKTVLTSLLSALVATFALTAGAVPSTPAVTELAPVTITSEQPTAALDLNTADAATLQRSLSGIGKAKAEAIVAYRNANGNFASVDELIEVKGIGKALLERNRDRIVIN